MNRLHGILFLSSQGNTSSQSLRLSEIISNQRGFHLFLVTLESQVRLFHKMTLPQCWSLHCLPLYTILLFIFQWEQPAFLLIWHWTILLSIAKYLFENEFSDYFQNSLMLKILKALCWDFGEGAYLQLQGKYVIWRCIFSMILYLENKYSPHYKLRNARLNKVILADEKRKKIVIFNWREGMIFFKVYQREAWVL